MLWLAQLVLFAVVFGLSFMSGRVLDEWLSITINVVVIAERNPTHPINVKVTEATLTYVAIDDDGRPRPVGPLKV